MHAKIWINQTYNWSTAAEQPANLSELFLQHGCGVACQVLNQSNCFQQHGCRADCQTRNELNIFLLRGNLTSFNHIKPISTERLQRNLQFVKLILASHMRSSRPNSKKITWHGCRKTCQVLNESSLFTQHGCGAACQVLNGFQNAAAEQSTKC